MTDPLIDPQDPAIVDFVQTHCPEYLSPTNKAIRLYYTVRDSFKYNPLLISFRLEDNRASKIMEKKEGHCIAKAMFLCACLQAAGIPSKLGIAKVRNHMGTARLEKILRSNVLVPHGYTLAYLNGRWIKCTPAFNKALCDKLNCEALDWDGAHDSIFQPYDRNKEQFMEYLHDYGAFDDFPLEQVMDLMQAEYPHLFDQDNQLILEDILAEYS